MGNLIKNKQYIFIMKFSLFIAAAAASSITTAPFDECKTHADCGKFFNESMVCADIDEGIPGMVRFQYTMCTLHAFCGHSGTCKETGWTGKATCKPNAPPLPTTSLVTEAHKEAVEEMIFTTPRPENSPPSSEDA